MTDTAVLLFLGHSLRMNLVTIIPECCFFFFLNSLFCLVLVAALLSESNRARKSLHGREEKSLSELAYLFMSHNHQDPLHNVPPFGNDPYSWKAISRLESKHRRLNTFVLTFSTAFTMLHFSTSTVFR